MLNCGCETRSSCALVSIVASVIVGIVAAFLRYFAVIAPTAAFYWVLFGIAVVYPAVILISSSISGRGSSRCTCSALPIIFTGVAGTAITSLILLGITFAATSIIGAIITGLALGFLTLLISGILCLIRCKTGCTDSEEF